jgi:hypothetical protein
MVPEKKRRSRLSVLFFVGGVLFNYPILSLFSNDSKEIFGIPLLFAYVFTTWALLIGLTFMTGLSRDGHDSSSADRVP